MKYFNWIIIANISEINRQEARNAKGNFCRVRKAFRRSQNHQIQCKAQGTDKEACGPAVFHNCSHEAELELLLTSQVCDAPYMLLSWDELHPWRGRDSQAHCQHHRQRLLQGGDYGGVCPGCRQQQL